MKKRLLALALCLVMMTSLLPLTAAADYDPNDAANWIVGIEDGKTYCKEVSFTINCPTDYRVDYVGVDKELDGHTDQIDPVAGQYTISGCSGLIFVYIGFHGTNSNPDVWLNITINDDHTGIEDHICNNCGKSVHTWQFKAAGNTLTGYCGGANCDIKEVSVSLKADSVTLPKSPFKTARLEGWNDFQKAVPSAYYDPNSFDYKLNGEDVTDQSNPKAGNYQVGVRIYGLPSPVEYSGVAARANMDGNGYSAYLFTQYTAVDPAITAQTGDNRPIELMVGSVVVFSALAAAAFIVDSKRRLQQ